MAKRNASTRRNLRTRNVPRASGRDDVRRITPVFSRIGINESMGDYEFGKHVHPNYEVILVDRGVYRCALNGRELELHESEGVVVKPGDEHRDFCKPPLVYLAVGFTLESDLSRSPGAPGLFAPDVEPELQRFVMDRAVVSPIFAAIQAEADEPDALSAHLQDALLLQFFWRLVRALPDEAVSSSFLDVTYRQAFPAQLKRVFRANLSRSLSLKQMAELMGISESTLSHKCKSVLGTSPAKAFMKAKLDRAMQLLRNTSLLVKEVAHELGFEDQYAFTRAFTREFGKSPTACR
jgi:AraC-like DNA-binding protein